MNSASLQAGHRIKSNTLRGGYVHNSNVYRVTAGTVGGPLLLIQGNYGGQTGNYPPDLTGITLAGCGRVDRRELGAVCFRPGGQGRHRRRCRAGVMRWNVPTTKGC